MDVFETDVTRRNFISTPVKLIPAVALAGAAGLGITAQAQAQTKTTVEDKAQEKPAADALQVEPPAGKKKIVIIATGGTIAGTASEEKELIAYTAAQKTVNELLAGIPVPDNVEFEGYQLAQVDSKDMSFEIWRKLAIKVEEVIARPDVQGIVITHGTDTLEETAYFLHLTVDATKPVVLTAAMRPATAFGADGPLNLINSITLASHADAKGIMTMLDGFIYSGEEIRKTHTYRVQSFSAGEAGALGTIEGDAVRQWRPWPVGEQVLKPAQLPEDTSKWPWVEVVESCAGTTGAIVSVLVKAGVNGIVVAATGNGTIHEKMVEKLKEAQAKNIPVVRAARVGDGVILGADDDGIVKSKCTLPKKARVLMIVERMRGGVIAK